MTKLHQYLKETGIRQGQLADRLKISRGYMSQLVTGMKEPGLAVAVRIERATNGYVPAHSWVSDSSLANFDCEADQPSQKAS